MMILKHSFFNNLSGIAFRRTSEAPYRRVELDTHREHKLDAYKYPHWHVAKIFDTYHFLSLHAKDVLKTTIKKSLPPTAF